VSIEDCRRDTSKAFDSRTIVVRGKCARQYFLETPCRVLSGEARRIRVGGRRKHRQEDKKQTRDPQQICSTRTLLLEPLKAYLRFSPDSELAGEYRGWLPGT
jgi:hypothetical protein